MHPSMIKCDVALILIFSFHCIGFWLLQLFPSGARSYEVLCFSLEKRKKTWPSTLFCCSEHAFFKMLLFTFSAVCVSFSATECEIVNDNDVSQRFA